MAEDIGGICREYVDDNVDSVSGLSKDEAVLALVDGVRHQLDKSGWGDAAIEFGIDIEAVVSDQLRQYRAKN